MKFLTLSLPLSFHAYMDSNDQHSVSVTEIYGTPIVIAIGSCDPQRLVEAYAATQQLQVGHTNLNLDDVVTAPDVGPLDKNVADAVALEASRILGDRDLEKDELQRLVDKFELERN